MKIHEYQAKELFRSYGVAVPEGQVAETKEKAVEIADRLGYPCVVKAQVHAGGRGKAGGIRLVANREEALRAAGEIIGMRLISRQTGSEGRLVRRVLVEQGLHIVRELYLAVIIDRERECPVIIASAQGGMEIEELAQEHPEKIIKQHVHPVIGLTSAHIRNVAFKLDLNDVQRNHFSTLLAALFKFFMERDASLAEINPLIVTADDRVLALDGKVTFDENALPRHPDIGRLRDILEEEPLEVQASRFGLNYIKLDGNIGCMVNGAGLAMATMDMIKYHGGEPANFLDVGGGTSVERVKEAFRILLADEKVQSVLVNIFGGIVRTDLVANGVVNAIQGMELKVPLIVRLVGTNEEEGKRILQESGIPLITETDLSVAVKQAVDLAGKGGLSCRS